METYIRLFSTDDIEFALAQTSREGWDATRELFEMLLAHDPDGCFVAERGGERVGMVTTTTYLRTAWIGNLIVPPEQRQGGLGSCLMMHAMGHVSNRGLRTVRLEADPPGVRIYRRLGFVDEFESFRFKSERPAEYRHMVERWERSAERLGGADLRELAAFDARFFGDDRLRLLGLMLARAREAYWVRGEGTVRAYAMALPAAYGIKIGPWVAEDVTAARAVLGPILMSAHSQAVGLGVSSVNHEAVELLTSLGFQSTPSCLRMVWGEPGGRGEPERLFGIGGGAMG